MWGCIALALQLMLPSDSVRVEPRPYLQSAVSIGRWIASLDTSSAALWPDDALRPGVSYGIADGIAGKTLLFHALHQATGDTAFARHARRGADALTRELRRNAPPPPFPSAASFYYRNAGMAFTLQRVGRALSEAQYRDAAAAVFDRLGATAAVTRDTTWSSFQDVLFGDAGTALAVADFARLENHAAARELASLAGRRLLASADTTGSGISWVLRRGTPNNLPNFSHGTAGVGFLLTRLFALTGDSVFLNGARGALRYLDAIAYREGNEYRVPYGMNSSEWRERYEPSWSHGSAGTLRFLLELRKYEPGLDARVDALMNSLRLATSHPDALLREYGFDLRFGVTGVARGYIERYRAGGSAADLEQAKRLMDAVLSAGVRGETALWWEVPRKSFMEAPGEAARFTGVLHGAAGVGIVLLELDAAMNRNTPVLTWPDQPTLP